MSEVICALVAAHWEQRFLASLKILKQERFLPPEAIRVKDFIQGYGFVDDVNMMSRWLCRCCLQVLAQRLLPPEIGYSRKSVTDAYRFLNIFLHFYGAGVFATPFNANHGYAIGSSNVQEVGRIPPNLGAVRWPRTMVRAYIRQKFAVHRQILSPSPDADLRQAAVEYWDLAACREVIRKRYTKGELIKILASFPPLKNDSAVSAVRTVLRSEARFEKTLSYGFSSDS